MHSKIINVELKIQVETNGAMSDEAFDRFVDSMIPRLQDMYPIVRGSAKATLLGLEEKPKRKRVAKKSSKRKRMKPAITRRTLYRGGTNRE